MTESDLKDLSKTLWMVMQNATQGKDSIWRIPFKITIVIDPLACDGTLSKKALYEAKKHPH